MQCLFKIKEILLIKVSHPIMLRCPSCNALIARAVSAGSNFTAPIPWLIDETVNIVLVFVGFFLIPIESACVWAELSESASSQVGIWLMGSGISRIVGTPAYIWGVGSSVACVIRSTIIINWLPLALVWCHQLVNIYLLILFKLISSILYT